MCIWGASLPSTSPWLPNSAWSIRVRIDGIRHSSYTGLLLLALGIGMCFGNIASIAVILLPVIALMMRRMRIEEEALANGLGNAYRAYMGRTKRLIPGLY